ncbi:MAG TPA: hypothetical protein VN578_22930 [Candidatus Binatia bacterium]|jgi:hypothetical protein|nr:hypothetical protein [Candidatus Binatia bacterium]
MKTPLCTYTHLGFLINWIKDERPDLDVTFAEIHEAAHEGRFIELLRERFGHIADFSLLRNSPFLNLEQMEAALSDAACALEGREAGKACVQRSGLCLAQAIVLEAIQQQFHRFPSGPEQWRSEPVAPAPHGGEGHPNSPFDEPSLGWVGLGVQGDRTSLFPSPRPSPLGRGRIPARLLRNQAETSGGDNSQPGSGLKLADWLQLAFLVNSLGDSSAGHDLPFEEVYESIDGGYFPLILKAYAGRCPDFSFMQSPDGSFEELNTALRAVAAKFRGYHFQKGGVAANGFCLAVALVLEAIRQKFAAVPQAGHTEPSFTDN